MVTRVIKINYSFGTTLINTSSTEKVMRIIKMITMKAKFFDLLMENWTSVLIRGSLGARDFACFHKHEPGLLS